MLSPSMFTIADDSWSTVTIIALPIIVRIIVNKHLKPNAGFYKYKVSIKINYLP